MNWLTKIGSAFVVVILVMMLAITFSRQPRDEIMAILAGRSGAGQFDGEEISMRMIAIADSNCRDRLQQFGGPSGKIPEFLVQRCITSQTRELYVLPKIAREMGLAVLPASIEKAALERARANFKRQAGLHAEDRLSLDELYRRELANYPVDLQVRVGEAQRVYEKLGRNFPMSEAALRSEELAKKITLDVRIVRYTTADLNNALESQVSASEEEIRRQYDEEQKKLSDNQKKKFDEEKEFVKNRIKTQKKQVLMADIKTKLSKLGANPSLDEVAKITGVPAKRIPGVSLEGLAAVPLGDKEAAKLNLPGILVDLKGGPGPVTSGPHQDQDQTIYFEATNVRIPDIKVETAKVDKESEDKTQRAALGFLGFIIEREAARGKFALYKKAFGGKDAGREPVQMPDDF
ncbi:MAG: hypothetical protein HY042_01455 [Spirochaetia bacterium]|nr:hypothetical protein [Spirochaetia bacterium]